MNYFVLSFVFVLCLLISCKSEPNKRQKDNSPDIQKLEKEVLALHDEVMPWMGDMHKLEKQLRKRARQVPDSMEILVSAANELQAADSLMWDWMHAYRDPAKLLDSLDEQTVIQYLQKEKIRAGRVNSSMKKGIRQAKELLGTK